MKTFLSAAVGLVCLVSFLSAGVERQFEQARMVTFLSDKRLTVTVDYAATKVAILTQTAVANLTATATPVPDKNSPTPTVTSTPSPTPNPKVTDTPVGK